MPISTFLNGRTPTQLRGLQWLAFSDTGITQTLTATSDSGGGASQAWVASGTVSCRIDPLTTRSRVTGGQIDERSSHVVTVPIGTAIDTTNRFVITNRGTFEVTATHHETSELARSFEVIQLQ